MLPLLMHVAIHASSVYVKSWTVHHPELSSAPIVDFVDATKFIDVVNFISVAEFNSIPLCHSNTISSSLGQSIVQTCHQPLLLLMLSNSTLLLNLLTLSIPTLSTVSKPTLFRRRTPDKFNHVTNLPYQKKLMSSLNQI